MTLLTLLVIDYFKFNAAALLNKLSYISYHFFSVFISRVVVFFFLSLLVVNKTTCQDIYIAPGTNFFVHGDTIAVNLNVYNSGNIGSKPGAVFNFMGLLWSNDSTATFPDEGSYLSGSSLPTSFAGQGGMFRFHSPIKVAGSPQLLRGTYSAASMDGPSFPNFQIENTEGVYLIGNSDTRIRNLMSFNAGKFFLNGNNLVVGNNTSPGTINGYGSDTYIVTGDEVNGGFLYRTHLDNKFDNSIFPIGANDSFYTPIAITYNGNAQNFKVRSFNHIFSNGISGTDGDTSFIRTTWNIRKENNENAAISITAQHPIEIEGSRFTSHRVSSFITKFDSLQHVWDTVPPSGIIVPGTLTTTTPQIYSYENARSFLMPFSTNEYVSKSVAIIPATVSAIGIEKFVDGITPQTDGSYNIHYRIVVKNMGKGALNKITVSDNLSAAFSLPVTVSVLSISASGTLVANNNYNGLNTGADTILTLPTSHLNFLGADTIHLIVNVNLHQQSGTYYNTVYCTAFSSINNGLVPQVSSSVPVTLSPLKLHIPAGFSPNSDGFNDKFVIANAADYNITMEVFNRWGDKVYDSKGFYNNDWDGTCNQSGTLFNSKLPNGTYFYIINATVKQTGVTMHFNGSITLKK
jgi:gliding motility-associated-like protein